VNEPFGAREKKVGWKQKGKSVPLQTNCMEKQGFRCCQMGTLLRKHDSSQKNARQTPKQPFAQDRFGAGQKKRVAGSRRQKVSLQGGSL